MAVQFSSTPSRKRKVIGDGLVDKLINNLPIELHLPGYQFCGPGTKLEKRLARGDQGINPLDSACREHDIAYSKHKDLESRHIADKVLAERAWERVKAKDSSIGERTNAWLVTNAMKTKTKFGMGVERPNLKKEKSTKLKSTKCCRSKLFTKAVKKAIKFIKKHKPESIEDAVKIAQKSLKSTFRKTNPLDISVPRVIPIPKIGGFLPLIPILSALGAIGGLASGSSAIVKAVNDAKAAKKQLEEANRHNKTMESIAMGKGLYLKPYRKGYGLYYKPYAKN